MLETLEKGNCPQPSVSENAVPRLELHRKLVELFTQPQDDNFYLITGESGSGKTTAIRKAAIEVGAGVIYVDVPSSLLSLPQAITKSFNYTEELNFWQTSSPICESVLATLSKVANDYYRLSQNKPLVLIIDNANQIAKQDLQLWTSLQYFAKTEAQANRIKIFFVTGTEEMIPTLYLGGSHNDIKC